MHQAGGSPQISQPELGRARFGNCREYKQIPGPWSQPKTTGAKTTQVGGQRS